MGSRRRGRACVRIALALALGAPGSARGEMSPEVAQALERMRQELEALRATVAAQQETIGRLEAERARRADAPAAPSPSPAEALDRALAESEPPPPAPAAPPAARGPSLAARPLGGTGAALRLIDLSFIDLFAVGSSTADDEEIETLQGGAHDPRRRGFTLQQGELSLAGAVDPYFVGEAHAVYTDELVELEEAFFTTTALPWGLQVKGGHFLTEFGRLNPLHAHAWSWIDQPIVNTRLLGGDGARNPGMRLGWLLPTPWFSEAYLGAQTARGETMVSFLGDAGEPATVGGRPATDRRVRALEDLLWLARWEHAFDVTDTLSTKAGVSGLFGPNPTGADAETRVYGADVVWKWRPRTNFRGWPFVVWETEAMKRDFEAAPVVDAAGILVRDGTTLRDWGLYTQVLWGFRHPWAAGVRYEHATGSGASVGGRDADPLRDDRTRVAPLLVWQPTEFSRLRLQYNFDDADHLARDAHSVWFGFEVLHGSHAAHRY